MRRAAVLIVDDDDVEQVIAPHRARRAQRFDIALAFATTEAEIRARLAEQRFDLVLCDNRMPPFADYRDVANAVRTAGHRGPIAVATASTLDPCFDEFRAHGILEVVDKYHLDGPAFDRLLAAALSRH